jgi:hypothetical protein
MKIKIIQNRNASRVFIHVGVNSQIRLRLPVVEWLNIAKNDYVLVGTDESEGDKPTAIYIVKSYKKDDYRGYKVSNGNGAHHISGKSLIEHFKLKKPMAYPYEMIDDKESGKMIKILI